MTYRLVKSEKSNVKFSLFTLNITLLPPDLRAVMQKRKQVKVILTEAVARYAAKHFARRKIVKKWCFFLIKQLS